MQCAIEDEEKILTGAFAEESARCERDTFTESETPRLARDELSREIVSARFRARWNRVRCETLPAGDARIDALLEHVAAEIGAHLPRRDRDIGRGFCGETKTTKTAERHRSQIRGAESVRGYHFAARGLQLI